MHRTKSRLSRQRMSRLSMDTSLTISRVRYLDDLCLSASSLVWIVAFEYKPADRCPPSVHHLSVIEQTGPWYDAWKVGPLNSHFNERNKSAHGERRRLVASAYSLNHLKTLEHSVDESVDKLCKKYLDVAAAATGAAKDGMEKEGGMVDMAKLTEWFCYDSVAQIAWGKTYGKLDFMSFLLSHCKCTLLTALRSVLCSLCRPARPRWRSYWINRRSWCWNNLNF